MPNQRELDLAYAQSVCDILEIPIPKIEYIRDFKNVAQYEDLRNLISMCENWDYTKRIGILCRYLVIAHELVHAKQYRTKEMIDTWDGTTFKGQFISNKEYSDMDYDLVPWEKEANIMMWVLRDKAILALKEKGILIVPGDHLIVEAPEPPKSKQLINSYDRILEIALGRRSRAA